MRKLFIVISIIMCTIFLTLNAYQTLELTDWETQTEFYEYSYGTNQIAIDFNGDGFDDLIVGAPSHIVCDTDSLSIKGRLYYFSGSETGLNTEPDFFLQHDFQNTIPDSVRDFRTFTFKNLEKIGDVNGDNIDDFSYVGDNLSFVGSRLHWTRVINIVFGNSLLDMNVGHTLLLNRGTTKELRGIGDFNGDGYDDMCFTNGEDEIIPISYHLVMGGTFNIIDLADDIIRSVPTSIHGLGDINGDGLSDVSYTIGGTEQVIDGEGLERWRYTNFIVLGNSSLSIEPDYTFETTVHGRWGGLLPLGDFNNDGFDDFFNSSYEVINSESGGLRLWLGGNNFNFDSYTHLEHFSIVCDYIYSDINNDGYNDFYYSEGSYFNGWYRGYLGGLNGTCDIYGGMNEYNYGKSCVIGDFNNDGIKEIIMGIPNSDSIHQLGRLIMYSCSEDLVELDTDINTDIQEDQLAPIELKLEAYPNPFNPEITISFDVIQESKVELGIYNLKGQKIKTLVNSMTSKGNHRIIWNGTNNDGKKVSSGVYLYKMSSKGFSKTRKMIMMK